MKWLDIAVCLASAAAALPAADILVAREAAQALAVTDEVLFKITLPEFLSLREKGEPAALDWSSDGCTAAPDYPFDFSFLPACERHDFGYRNYHAQSRLDESNRLAVDQQFRADLLNQCAGESISDRKLKCAALAQVYYTAVRAFGDKVSFDKRDENVGREMKLVEDHQHAVAAYDALVKDAQQAGDLPKL